MACASHEGGVAGSGGHWLPCYGDAQAALRRGSRGEKLRLPANKQREPKASRQQPCESHGRILEADPPTPVKPSVDFDDCSPSQHLTAAL